MNRRAVLALGLAAVLSACGIQSDTKPRDIAENDKQELGGAVVPGGGVATGKARIYLIGPATTGQTALLQPVARTADTATALIRSLLSGPNDTEVAQQYRTAVPLGTTLRSATLQINTLRVDVTEQLLQLSGADLVDALAQIVFTASELDGVRQVKVLVNGAEQQWPAGNGTLQSTPLTVYDFPGRVPSAQPAYPAIPTPSDGG
jgi:spore germination protein GerM